MDIFETIHKTHLYNSYKEAQKFAKAIPEKTWNQMSEILFNQSNTKSHDDIKICKVNKNIFQEGQIFYHGEKNNKIAKSYVIDENHIICEELGDGLYVTPSRKVAAFWAGVNGKIFKLKLNTDKIAKVNQKQIEAVINVIASNVENFSSNATGELLNVIIRMLFQKNGFDAAFSDKSLSNGFMNAGYFFDTIIGETQQQLVIYNSNVVEILPKNLLEKFSNKILQIKSYIQYYKNLLKIL